MDQACSCNEDYHATLEYSTDMNTGPCACQSSWEYFEEEYYGCDETADWPGNTWCYINGDTSQCPSAEDSFIDTETRSWTRCMYDPCACQSSWEYFEEEYYGCDETADWPGNTWCYINGDTSQCPSAEDSFIANETRVWATCMASTSIAATSMECTRCPQGSSSPAGSNNSSAW